MTEKSEDKGANIPKMWVESYLAISKIWEGSYLNLYKPWLDTTGDLFAKAVEISKNNTPEKYKEFYEEYLKIYQNNVTQLQKPITKSNKDVLEKILLSAEKSSKFYKSLVVELEENSRKTRDALTGEQSPAKYKEIYDMWIKTYGNIFEELLTVPFRENMKEMVENYAKVTDMYVEFFGQVPKLYKNALCTPSWIESTQKLQDKYLEIAKGNASSDAYKEFYNLWSDVYQQIYGKFLDIQSPKLKENFENFVNSTDMYIELYKSWITTLEKMSSKAKSKQYPGSDSYKEFYALWTKIYQKSFDNFFENAPTVGPFKNFLEPVNNATKIYVDSFSRVSQFW